MTNIPVRLFPIFLELHTFLISSDRRSTFTPYFGLWMFIMYSIVCVLVSFDWISSPDFATSRSSLLNSHTQLETMFFFYICILYALTAISFVVFGALFTRLFAKSPALLARTKVIYPRVKRLTILCVICFAVRTFVSMYDLLSPLPSWWWLDGVYYSSLEIVPLFSMLLILRGSFPALTSIAESVG